jgi:hypothetical protein
LSIALQYFFAIRRVVLLFMSRDFALMMLVLSFIKVVAKLNLFKSIYLSLARDWEAGYTL